MSNKPTELHIGTPKAYDSSAKKATIWLQSVLFYLNVNADIYNTDAKKITITLFFMRKGAALSWAATFHNSAIFGSISNMEIFTDFVLKFETSFKHYNTTGNAVAWLSTK